MKMGCRPGLMFMAVFCWAAVLIPTLATVARADQTQVSETVGTSGLPIPRFVSLGSKKVYVRTGPGKQYPIDWVYIRKDLPVEVIAEYDTWRRVKDHDGSTGWVVGSLLSGRRMVVIVHQIETLYDKPEIASAPVLRAEPGVLGELRQCHPGWCQIEVAGRTGWMETTGIWGINKADIKR